MGEEISITAERVDDIPVLLAQIRKMGVPELLDQHLPPHGNWAGTSLGWTASIWLAHILSEGDHRLSWVQEWVAARLESVRISSGQEVRALEWSDDRLGIVLDALSQDEAWAAFERAVNRQTIRVYNLTTERVRLDSTSASGYWQVTEDGLFQFGHSKDHRPDLPQVKVMLSALDPLGLPVATQVVGGQSADDPLYVPALREVHDSLNVAGLLYVGDCKMSALATRAFAHHQGDYYLCPLSEKQLPAEVLAEYLAPVWANEIQPTPIYRDRDRDRDRDDAPGPPQQIAQGFEREVALTYQDEQMGWGVSWVERHLVVRSLQYAQSSTEALRTRLTKAQLELAELNERRQGKKRPRTHEELHVAAQAILKHHRVEGLIKLNILEQVTETPVRAYGPRPATLRVESTFTLQAEVDEPAVAHACRFFGWRVYATNQPAYTLSLAQAVLVYREEYLIERGFARLKGKCLSLTPMYLQSDARVTGLIRLLSIGLRLISVIEFQARRCLAVHHDRLAGLYAGNPKRATSRPTAESLLHAFEGITLSVVTLQDRLFRHLTPLSNLHRKILALLDLSTDIYACLAVDSS